MNNPRGGPSIMAWETIASGYAGVWATDNTREALFDAMQRKETYATTGPRMIVRFFGGWDFDMRDAQNRMPAEIGYRKGVPMGGDLRAAPQGKAPTFLVAALKDPIGANLDRVQIVKGWLDAKGETARAGLRHRMVRQPHEGRGRQAARRRQHGRRRERHVDEHDRRAGADHRRGRTRASTRTQRAFYYVRVLEIPTPRWTAYDAKYYGIKLGPEVRVIQQERAVHVADLVHALRCARLEVDTP